MSPRPGDPTQPKDPLLIPRPRPGTVTLAGTLMLAGAAVGLLNALVVIAATGSSTEEFRARAGLTAATQEQIDEIAEGLATWSTTAGLTGLLLSLVLAVLAVRVMRGSHAARVAALVFVGTSILFGLGWSSFTVRGSANLQPEGMDEQTGRGVAEALGLSTSGLPTYVGGGLTCLQILGYLMVVGLLLWPASQPYFRRRRPPPWFGSGAGRGAGPSDPGRGGLFAWRRMNVLAGRRGWTTVIARRGRADRANRGDGEPDVTEPVR